MSRSRRAAMAAAGAVLLVGAVYLVPRLAVRGPGVEPPAVRAPSPRPPETPPAPEPTATEPEPLLAAAPLLPSGPEGSEELPPAVIRALLEGAFEEYLPNHKLSSTEYEQLTEAVVKIRALRREMAGLPVSVENAERLRELREALIEALSDFEYIAELSPAEFTAIVQPGVDAGEETREEDEPVLELLEDRAPRG